MIAIKVCIDEKESKIVKPIIKIELETFKSKSSDILTVVSKPTIALITKKPLAQFTMVSIDNI